MIELTEKRLTKIDRIHHSRKTPVVVIMLTVLLTVSSFQGFLSVAQCLHSASSQLVEIVLFGKKTVIHHHNQSAHHSHNFSHEHSAHDDHHYHQDDDYGSGPLTQDASDDALHLVVHLMDSIDFSILLPEVIKPFHSSHSSHATATYTNRPDPWLPSLYRPPRASFA